MKGKRNRTILLVDDNNVDRLYSKKFLESEGYLVREAEDLKDAVDQIRQGGLGLVILDVKMSEDDNRDLLDTISYIGLREKELPAC